MATAVLSSACDEQQPVAITFEQEPEFQSSKSKRHAEEELVATAAAADTWHQVARGGTGQLRRGRGRPRGSRSGHAAVRSRAASRSASRARGRPRGRPRLYPTNSRDTEDWTLLASTAYLDDYPSLIPLDAEDDDACDAPAAPSGGVRTRLRQCVIQHCAKPSDGAPLGDVFGFYELKDSVARLAQQVEPRICTEHTLVSRELHAKRRTLVGRKWKQNLAWQDCSQCAARTLVWCATEPAAGCVNHCGRRLQALQLQTLAAEVSGAGGLVRVSCGLLSSGADVLLKRQMDSLQQSFPFVCVVCYGKSYPTAVPAPPREVAAAPLLVHDDDDAELAPAKAPLLPPDDVRVAWGGDQRGVCSPLALKDFVAAHRCRLPLAELAPWAVAKHGTVLEFLLPLDDAWRVLLFDEADMTFSVLVAERLLECGTLALPSRHLCVPLRHALARLEALAPCQGVLAASTLEVVRQLAGWPEDAVRRTQLHFEPETGRQLVRSRQCARLREAATPPGRRNCAACAALALELRLPQHEVVDLKPPEDEPASSPQEEAVAAAACFKFGSDEAAAVCFEEAAEEAACGLLTAAAAEDTQAFDFL